MSLPACRSARTEPQYLQQRSGKRHVADVLASPPWMLDRRALVTASFATSAAA